MLKYFPIKLSRLIALDGNSKRHSTDKTMSSVLSHNFRDPIQVDLVFLDEQYQHLSPEDILSDDAIKLTLVEGHDRVLGVCKTLFKQDPNNPPGNIELVSGKNGNVIDWLIPATVTRSESKSKAIAYSIDHNLTTASVLGDDSALELFDPGLLYNQFDDLLSEGESISGFNTDLEDLAEQLLELRDTQQNISDTSEEDYQDDLPDDIDNIDNIDNPDDNDCRVKLGDLWQLGNHFLYCGNTLSDTDNILEIIGNANVNFVWSDPPYGVKIISTSGKLGGSVPFGSKKDWGVIGNSSKNICEAGTYAPIAGDNDINTAIDSSRWCLSTFSDATQIWWGANYYANSLPNSQCWFVWDKNNTGGYADCELAWVSLDKAARLFKHTWNGMIKESEHGQKRVHPTQKPVALVTEAIKLFHDKDQPLVIFDPFSGSGISILAAQSLDAVCYAVELSPEYCSVTIDRWEKLSGLTAKLIKHY